MKRPSTFGIIWFFGLTIAACGGGEKQVVDQRVTCDNEGDALAEKSPVCDREKYDTLKREIMAWEKSCKFLSSPATRNHLSQTLSDSKKCLDKAEAAIANKTECEGKIAAIAAEQSCDIEKCNALISALKEALDFCRPSVEHGFDESGARALIGAFEARIEQLKLNESYKQTIEHCKKAEAMVGSGKTNGALKELIPAIAPFVPIIEEPTDVENTIKKEATDVCSAALRTIINPYLKKMTDRLKNSKDDRDPLRWMVNYHHFLEIKAQLDDIKADKLIPESIGEMDKLLSDVDKKKDKMMREAAAKGEALYKNMLRKGAKKCKRFYAELSRIDKKIEEHKSKQNIKKINAYSKKRAQTEERLASFMLQLKESVAKSPFDAGKTEALLKEISAAGCRLEKRVKPE